MKTRMILERPRDRYSKPYDKYDYVAMTLLCLILGIIMLFGATCQEARAEGIPGYTGLYDKWLITAYCPCVRCCGKSDGVTASGKRAIPDHTVACNWLKFGQKVSINGKVYTVEDRGAKSLFGDKRHHIKHLDMYFKTHKEAVKWGKRQCEVVVL